MTSSAHRTSREALGIVFGATGIVIFAGFVLVAAPYLQLRNAPVPEDLKPYTKAQARGRAQYVSLGCVYCHSQQPRDPSIAPDDQRGWGRPSIPADYTYDYPHLLGTMRTGPDLLNIGVRQPSQAWHLLHLYQPRALVQGSIMPAYPFLFEVKAKAHDDEVVVDVPAPYGPAEGVVIAKPQALDLTAYLMGLDRTYAIDAALSVKESEE
ncbi:MAG: cbb3-type cytochrome c oxidase subunit II [Myxococcota bacterium]